MNAPQGDYAERLVAEAYGGELAPNSEKSWDVLSSTGERLQVKSRVVKDGEPTSARRASRSRSWEFNSAVIVFLSGADLSVVQATELPVGTVSDSSSWVERVNGWVLNPTQPLMASGTDVTERLPGRQNRSRTCAEGPPPQHTEPLPISCIAAYGC